MAKENLIEKLEELFESIPSKEMPYAFEVVDLLKTYYNNDELIDCFDNDELMYHLKSTIEMDDYVEERIEEDINEYIKEHPIPTKYDIIAQVQNYHKNDFKRFLCDLVDTGYHIKDEQLLETIKERIK